MIKLKFTKMVASGNDFVVIRNNVGLIVNGLSAMAKKICDRKYGVGADGLLVLEKSKVADVRMRIFNADGSEAEMCGNGARCAALFSHQLDIETKAGIIEAQVKGNNVKIKLTDPKNLKLDIPIKINNRMIKVNSINTGVPHAVIFVEGLEKINVAELGRQIRYHRKFSPAGTNVDFVEVLDKNNIQVRTYERGVEDETLACGTGSVASALIFALKSDVKGMINVHTQSGEVLKVCSEKQRGNFKNVWLEGKARIVYQGEYHV